MDGPNHVSLVVAGYANVREAAADFDALVAALRRDRLEIAAAVVVACSRDDELAVRDTVDAIGTTGTALAGRVGVVVGLMSPGTLAFAAPGASLCGVTAEFVDVRFKYALYETIAVGVPPGSAGIGVVAEGQPTTVLEGVLSRSRTVAVVGMDATELALLERHLADARASLRSEAHTW